MQQVIRTGENTSRPLSVAGVRDLIARGRDLNLTLCRLCGKAQPAVPASTVARWLAGDSTPLLSNLLEVEARLGRALAAEEKRLLDVLIEGRR